METSKCVILMERKWIKNLTSSKIWGFENIRDMSGIPDNLQTTWTSALTSEETASPFLKNRILENKTK